MPNFERYCPECGSNHVNIEWIEGNKKRRFLIKFFVGIIKLRLFIRSLIYDGIVDIIPNSLCLIKSVLRITSTILRRFALFISGEKNCHMS